MTTFAATTTKFSEFPLNEYIIKGLEEAGYNYCMPVQAQSLPHTLEGRDIFVQSQTGSGKTAAFLVSLFQIMLDDAPEDRGLALIIAPTRELAVQIETEAKLLGKYLSLASGCFYGGVGYYAQEKMLSEGVDIMIGTPGRILDLDQKGLLHLRRVKYLIIDEADRLFDMGFYPDIRRMISRMPRREVRQTMLFSATLDYRVRTLASENMNTPATVEITPETVTVDKITQELYHVGKREKMSLLLGLLDTYKPKSCIIFTNMKTIAEELNARFERNGIKSEFMMGDLAQSKRLKVLEQLKNGEISILVATDVAARGIHIDDLELVVNYDIPQDPENYVHRIGRTARAGKSGRAVTFACEQFVEHLPAVEKYIGSKIPVSFAEEDMYHVDASAGINFRYLRSDRDRDSRGSRDGRDSRGGRSSERSGRSGSGRSEGSSRSSSRPESGSRAPAPTRRPETALPKPIETVAPSSHHHHERPLNPNRKHHAEKAVVHHVTDGTKKKHEPKPGVIHKFKSFLFGKQ